MAIAVSQAFKDAFKGPVDRSLLKLEVYLGGSWVDLTSYIEEASGALEEISNLSGGASANTLNITLINDDGRFSPKNTAGPYYGNLVPNKPCRLSFLIPGESVRGATVYVSNWIPSAKSRNCQVTAEDAARILRRKDIVEETVFNDVAPTTGYYLTRVIERAAWLSGLRWDTCNTKTDTSGNAWAYSSHDGTGITVNKSGGATRATYTLGGVLVMTLDLVDLLLPCTPLKGKALAVLDQLAKVVDGVVYFDAQGQLCFRSRMYRNDSTLTSVEAFTVSSLDDVTAQVNFEDSKWQQLCNRATVKSTPWAFKTDTSGAVVEEEVPFKGDLFAKYFFNAGEKYPDYVADANAADLWCEIPNGIKLFKASGYPSAANMVLTSVDNADPTKKSNGIQFQTAADCPLPGPAVNFPVFEQTRVRVAFKNTGSTAQRIENLTLKAKLMRPIQRCQSVQKNDTSIGLYDQRDKEVSNDFIPTSQACKQLAAWLVEDGRQPKDYYTLPVMYGCPWIELGDKITVSETITNTIPAATEAIVRRITWRWTLAAFVFTIEACSPAANFSAGSIPATVTNVETLNQNQNGQQANSIGIPVIDQSGSQVGLNNIPEFTNILNSYRKFTYAGSDNYVTTFGNSTSTDNAAVFSVGSTGKVQKINPFDGTLTASASFTDGGTAIGFFGCTFVPNASNRYLWAIGLVGGSYKLYVIDPALGACTLKHNFGATGILSQVFYDGSSVWVSYKDSGALKMAKFTNLGASLNAPVATYTVEPFVSGTNNAIGYGVFDGRKYLYIPNTKEVGAASTGYVYRIDITDGSSTSFSVSDALIKSVVATQDGLWAGLTTQLLKLAFTGSGIASTASFTLPVPGNDRLLFTGRYLLAMGSQSHMQVNPVTGSVIGTYTSPPVVAYQAAFDGEAVWLGGNSDYLARIRLIEAR